MYDFIKTGGLIIAETDQPVFSIEWDSIWYQLDYVTAKRLQRLSQLFSMLVFVEIYSQTALFNPWRRRIE
jgi:hypothetical protein